MNIKADALLKRLLATFKPEADEHLAAMSAGLLELEKSPPAERRQTIVETVYREAHSLKGAARTVNLTQIESLCQSMETLLAALKHGKLDATPGLFDGLHRALNIIGRLIAGSEQGESIREAVAAAEIQRQLMALEKTIAQDPKPPLAAAPSPAGAPKKPDQVNAARPMQAAPTASPPPAIPTASEESAGIPAPGRPQFADRPVLPETVRIATAKLDSVLLQAEEMLLVKLAATQRMHDLREVVVLLERWNKKWSGLTPELYALRQAAEGSGSPDQNRLNSVQVKKVQDFLNWTQRHFDALADKVLPIAKHSEQDARVVGGMIENLLDDVKKVMMQPCSALLETFPKMVREISRAQGKEANLVMDGGEVEIDKRILEEMKVPLVHILRNSLDHGLEKPEERVKKGKPPCGELKIAVTQKEGGKIEICVADDGGGIEVTKVKQAAVERGLLTAAEAGALGEQAALNLIFQSEISTSSIITDLSGRGLGLAIVREKLDKLGGSVKVETKPGTGTTFRIVLPVTLTTFRGILVRVSDQMFIIPTVHIGRVARIKRDSIKTVENRETILLDGLAVALCRMEEVLQIPGREPEGGGHESFVQVLVLNNGGQRIAFSVSQILNEQEVLVKPLTKPLLGVRNVAGATVIGNGKVVAILNVSDLIRSALSAAADGRRTTGTAETETKNKSVLVVEDSITSRMLLMNILESAGYLVETAVDGAEGWTKLKSGNFGLVVSDVEMPRMNGFELTEKIRADKAFGRLPVVLVTSLQNREHRERGIEAGANAYIVKSSFDQSNLLEVIGRLL